MNKYIFILQIDPSLESNKNPIKGYEKTKKNKCDTHEERQKNSIDHIRQEFPFQCASERFSPLKSKKSISHLLDIFCCLTFFDWLAVIMNRVWRRSLSFEQTFKS